jgi:hypothetical protein
MIKILILLAVLTGGTIQCNFAQSYRSSNIPKAEILHSCRVDVLDERGVRKGRTNLSRGDIFAIEKDFGGYVLIFIEGGFASVNKSDIRINCKSGPSFDGIGDDTYDTYSGAQKALQSAIARDPNAYAYSYGELDKKYPVAATRPIAPAWIQDEIDDADLERKARKLEVQKAEAELQLIQRQVMQASQGNLAPSDQLALAVKKMQGLNTRDASFMIKRDEIKRRHPQAFNDNAFIEIIDKPRYLDHQRFKSGH